MKLTTPALATFALLMVNAPAFAQAPEGQPELMPGRMDQRGEVPMMPRGMMRMMGGMMASADHFEGRLLFLKTELKITDAQMPQWNVFADALRANAKRMKEVRSEMMGSGATGMMSASAPERLERMEKFMSSHVEALRTTRGALQPLYAVLSDEQKKTADALIHGPLGMM